MRALDLAPRNLPLWGRRPKAGGGAFSTAAALACAAKTPPTDRCAIASPRGGGSL